VVISDFALKSADLLDGCVVLLSAYMCCGGYEKITISFIHTSNKALITLR